MDAYSIQFSKLEQMITKAVNRNKGFLSVKKDLIPIEKYIKEQLELDEVLVNQMVLGGSLKINSNIISSTSYTIESDANRSLSELSIEYKEEGKVKKASLHLFITTFQANGKSQVIKYYIDKNTN